MIQLPVNSATSWAPSLQHTAFEGTLHTQATTVLNDTPFSGYTTVYLHIQLLEGILVVSNLDNCEDSYYKHSGFSGHFI
jgi:hypothetical protein